MWFIIWKSSGSGFFHVCSDTLMCCYFTTPFTHLWSFVVHLKSQRCFDDNVVVVVVIVFIINTTQMEFIILYDKHVLIVNSHFLSTLFHFDLFRVNPNKFEKNSSSFHLKRRNLYTNYMPAFMLLYPPNSER